MSKIWPKNEFMLKWALYATSELYLHGLPIYADWTRLLLSVGLAHFQFKGGWMVFFILY